jgi:hypothetical protein
MQLINELRMSLTRKPTMSNFSEGVKMVQKEFLGKNQEIWIPKALCIASAFPFYDYFKAILEDLYLGISCYKLSTVIEAHLFNIVFQIPAPIRNKEIVRYPRLTDKPLKMSQPGILELPYMNLSFFQLMLANISPDDIVTIFTCLLFEKKILLVAPSHD